MQRQSGVFVMLTMIALNLYGYGIDSLSHREDTIIIRKDEILMLHDTILAPINDTIFIVDEPYKTKKNPYETSEEFFKKVRQYLGEAEVTRELLGLIYINKDLKYENQPTSKLRTSNTPFEPYRDKTIGKIRIKKVDAIEGSVYDTARIATSRLVRLANQVHINTWNSVIRNNMTLEIGEKIDPYKIADNERQIRRLRFIEDAKIYVSEDSSGSVALIVVIKDRLSWGIDGVLRGIDAYDLELYSRSMGGSGQFASATWLYDANNSPKSGYQLGVGGQNINKVISSWRARYLHYGDRKHWNLSMDKEFVSPDIKYGGGIGLRSIQDTRLIIDGEGIDNGNFHLNSQDFWVGRSFKVFNKRARTNLIITGRLLNNHFEQKPFVSLDSNFLFYDRKMVLGAVSLSQQKFIKANYVLGFGIAEDIPNGYKLSLIGGRDFNEFYKHNYLAGSVFKSFYVHDLGYLFTNIEFGTFYNQQYEHGVLDATIGYFSPLIKVDNFFIRNFLYTNFTQGIRQNRSRTINLEDYVRDSNFSYQGNSLLSLRVESVVFTPLYLLGFRFAPFFFYSNVQISESRATPPASRGFQGAGFGLRMKNESLVFDTFEFRTIRYLSSPNGGELFFELSASTPLSFERVFRFKPTLIPFE